MNNSVLALLTILCLFSVSSITGLIQTVKADSGTIYINADGSISPSTAPIQRNGDTYTLTGNISSDADGIVIERDNMILNGAGFSLQGPEVEMGTDSGIDVSYGSNVTIESVEINGFSRGVFLNSSYTTISENNVSNCFCGIIISSSSSNCVSGNNIIGNYESDVMYKGIGIDIIFSSSNNMVSENNITNGYFGGQALYGYAGVQIVGCSDNNILENNITNSDYGVYLDSSNNNTISRNSVASNDHYGMILLQSSYNTISENSMTANYNASILLEGSSNNTISGNSMTDSGCGVDLEAYGTGSSNNEICENNITGNGAGISLSYSSNNIFYNNNFMNNTNQVSSDNNSANAWDDGSSGNYWSDYLTKYPNATQVDSSGVCNAPYVIDTNNTDHYPLSVQYVVPEFPSIPATMFFTLLTLLAVIICKKKGMKTSQS